MKILILCPYIDAQHEISIKLRSAAAALLFPADVSEAWKLIEHHGASLDLAVIHREGMGSEATGATSASTNRNARGLELVARIKSDTHQADLPIIVTSSEWGDAEFATHQQGRQGANAYLAWPFTPAQLVQVIETMFGSQLRFASSAQTQSGFSSPVEPPDLDPGFDQTSETHATASTAATRVDAPPHFPSRQSTPPRSSGEPGTIVLEDVSALVDISKSLNSGSPELEIRLDAPDSRSDQGDGSTTRLEAAAGINPTVLGQFGTAMLDSAHVAPPPMEPPAPAPKLPDPVPEPEHKIDLGTQELDQLEPHERLALANPNVRTGSFVLDLGAHLSQSDRLGAIEQDVHHRQNETSRLTSATEGTGISISEPSSLEGLELPAGIELGSPQSPGQPYELPAATPAEFAGTMNLDRAALAQALQPAPAPEPIAPSPEDERELRDELPYLFNQGGGSNLAAPASDPDRSRLFFAEPIGDAVVPGGASNAPDVETLKKYLILREQDVAVLSNQLRTMREQYAALEGHLKTERAKSAELAHCVGDHGRKIEELNKDKSLSLGGLQSEIDELRFQYKAKTDRVRLLESQVRDAADEIERLKERVRGDIRKIRVRERELENRLEIMKKDSEALIAARENKIIELKRKVDLLEFNMDLLQDQYTREKETSSVLRERLAKAAQVVRVAGGLLDSRSRQEGDAAGEGAASGELGAQLQKGTGSKAAS